MKAAELAAAMEGVCAAWSGWAVALHWLNAAGLASGHGSGGGLP